MQENKAVNSKKPLLIQCLKVRYIGEEILNFKDTLGFVYKLKNGDEFIIPKGSLEQHIKARSNLFKIL